MYISVLPIAISVRRTNVYEEKSLGIYGSSGEEQEESEPSYVGAHLRRQLSFDLWYIFLGFFIITISEGPQIQSGDPSFTMFTVLFEVVSAYGTVGLSLGYPGINASFSAEFGVIAKLIIIAMQIRGRHRGLPYELDRAILLPSESLHEEEDRDAATRIRPHSSGASIEDAGEASHRGRSRSQDRRRGPNFLSGMLHPGPSIPNSHQHRHRSGPGAEPQHGSSQLESTNLPPNTSLEKTTSSRAPSSALEL
jgi:Cation transport protein